MHVAVLLTQSIVTLKDISFLVLYLLGVVGLLSVQPRVMLTPILIHAYMIDANILKL